MLRCIAIDDEQPALELLEDYISKVPYLQLIGSFDDAIAAMHFIEQGQVDLAFIDIQMPALTGLQLVQSLSKKPLFILVTAYEKYALDAFYYNAVDYLLKPVPFDRFVKATNRANELHQLKLNPAGPSRPDHLFVYIDSAHKKILFADIDWIEAQKDYLRIYLANDPRPLVARMSMKSMEDQLPASQFIRIQKSYIVAKEKISAVKKASVIITGRELPIGELYKDSVFALLGKQPE